LLRRIKEKRTDLNENAVLKVVSDTGLPDRLRLKLIGARSVVVPGRTFWESASIDIGLAPTMESVNRVRPPLMGPLPDSLINDPRGKVKYALTVTVSGRYAAGGMPSDDNGYTLDFEANGYHAALDEFAQFVWNALKDQMMQFDFLADSATGEIQY
jgi:hypothetical protein